MFDKAGFFKSIESGEHPWLPEHGKELATALGMPAVLAALTKVAEMIETDSMSFQSIDFTKQEGISLAIRLQGRSSGMLDVLQMLADCAEGE